jgi:bacillithiol biosynthesis deacetylase BshB1
VARHAALGLQVGLCDLTRGEMSTNGTPDQRLAEAEAARQVLGAVWRENLNWSDRRIGKDPEHLDHVVQFIRRHRPRTVAVPYWHDRHPDHVAASALLTEAVFNAGLQRYPAEGNAWKPDWVCYYFVNDAATPSFVVDVSDCYDTKRRALDCHASQFTRADPRDTATRLNTPLFRQMIESRDAQFGALAGVRWAEGVIVRQPLVRASLLKSLP